MRLLGGCLLFKSKEPDLKFLSGLLLSGCYGDKYQKKTPPQRPFLD